MELTLSIKETVLGGDDMSHQEKCSQRDGRNPIKQILILVGDIMALIFYETPKRVERVNERRAELNERDVEFVEVFGNNDKPVKMTVSGRIVFKDGSMFNEDGTVRIVEE